MYAPEHFVERRLEILHAAIRGIGFSTLTSHDKDGLQASHIPTLLDASVGEFGVLEGHFARANPHWRSLAGGGDVLAIYTAADGYISPNWYPSKHETGKGVPTWNYLAIQAHGRIELFDDADALLDLVTRLTEVHEAPRAQPWAVADAPAAYIQGLLRAIVGFRITITRLEGAWKMSQNRPEPDQAGIRAGLAANGDPRAAAVAAVMNALPPKET